MWLLFRVLAATAATAGLFSIIPAKKQEEKSKKISAAPRRKIWQGPTPLPARDQPPVSWRDLLAIAAIVALADVAIDRGHGNAGYAALFPATNDYCSPSRRPIAACTLCECSTIRHRDGWSKAIWPGPPESAHAASTSSRIRWINAAAVWPSSSSSPIG